MEKRDTEGSGQAAKVQAPEAEGPGNSPAAPGGLKGWFAHAFAVGEYSADSLAPEERAALERLALGIHKRGLTPAAILWIDSQRGMNWIGSQALVFAEPLYDLAKPFLNFLLRLFGFGKKGYTLELSPEEYKLLYSALEKRYSIEYLVSRLEELQANDLPGGAPAAVDKAPAE
ncbi:hypothetical protein IT575_08050 [bacterium]|nr:hypothetical protein [bacterium]